MSDMPKVYVVGIGMITPVGLDTVMTASAVKAGVSAYRESNYFDEYYNNIRVATVPDVALESCLDEESLTCPMAARHARMLQMAKLALSEIMPMLPKGEKLPLFLAGPEPMGISDQPLNVSFIENLALQTGVNLDLEQCRVSSLGRVGGLNSIRLAFRYLESTNTKFVLVGGVDTFYDKDTLDYISKKKRLLCGEVMDGFIPGEAAGFLLLTNHPSAMTADRRPFVFEPGSGSEKGHLYSEETYTGDGLSTAVMVALKNANTSKIQTLYSSMNGESFFAKEHGVAMIRNNEALDEKMKLEHPADCFGDLGAASGIVMIGLSATNILTKRDATPILVCCSSDREQRSAVVIHA